MVKYTRIPVNPYMPFSGHRHQFGYITVYKRNRVYSLEAYFRKLRIMFLDFSLIPSDLGGCRFFNFGTLERSGGW